MTDNHDGTHTITITQPEGRPALTTIVKNGVDGQTPKVKAERDEAFNIKFANHDELIWHLHNTAYFERQETFSTPLLFEQKGITLEKFKVYFPDFMESARQELAQYRQAIGQHDYPEQLEHLIYTLFTHAENITTQLLANRPPIKVLIISNFDHALSLTLMDMLSYYCNNRFTFDYLG